MKQYNGKRMVFWDSNGHRFEGLCTGASDEEVKMLKDGETDERVFLVRNIFSYSIVGEGTTGGYSGLQAYVCKNESINCAGRVLLSSKECHVGDMNCEACDSNKNKNFKCDFGCIGAMEILPSRVQRALFDGMNIDRNRKKNYLEEATKSIYAQKSSNPEEQRD